MGAGGALVSGIVTFTAAGGTQSRVGFLRNSLVWVFVRSGLFGSPVSPVSVSLS